VSAAGGDAGAKPANRAGLPDKLKSGIENLSGFSMDDVRVHYNSPQPAQLRALAYTQGTDIHVAPGQERHLPHEAWHVVQQKQGRVKPTMHLRNGISVNDDTGLEQEADVMGNKALSLSTPKDQIGDTFAQKQSVTKRITFTKSSKQPVQRVVEGLDPVGDSNVLDPGHINDLLYGLANYRGVTMGRMNEPQNQKRTIDQYNQSVGINGDLINGQYAGISVYLVRNALENPSQWNDHVPTQIHYPNDAAIQAYQRGGGDLTNEQKWMTFLVREKHNIGLWDLGNTNRPIIGRNFFGSARRGEAEGLTRIKSKRRFEKNMHEDDAGTFSEEDVHKMLSFGLDTDAAQNYIQSLEFNKRQGIHRWIQNTFWRRTSKLGIDFATSDIGLDARIHFNLTSGVRQANGGWQPQLWGILDEIAADQGARKITESEWKYVVRLMERDPERLERIIPYSEYQ